MCFKEGMGGGYIFLVVCSGFIYMHIEEGNYLSIFTCPHKPTFSAGFKTICDGANASVTHGFILTEDFKSKFDGA